MFNNLNNSNTQGGGAVDDIFAETDQAANGANTDIETRRVGLVSGNEVPGAANNQMNIGAVNTQDDMASQMMSAETATTPKSPKNYLRWVIIGVIILAVLGAAYFVYSQFFNIQEPVVAEPTNNIVAPTPNNLNQTPIMPDNNSGFVDVVPEFASEMNDGSATNTEETMPEDILPEGESQFIDTEFLNPDAGLNENTPINPDATPGVSEGEFQAAVDSDGDGLSDAEEIALGTNINIIDTDNDGLSDYEEVKIYFTDPLNPDTDGDGYLDGDEVKGGYDPRVGGGAKLPGNAVLE